MLDPSELLDYSMSFTLFVKFGEACGARGEGVGKPDDIDSGESAVVRIMIEREADASSGVSLDKIVEQE